MIWRAIGSAAYDVLLCAMQMVEQAVEDIRYTWHIWKEKRKAMTALREARK